MRKLCTHRGDICSVTCIHTLGCYMALHAITRKGPGIAQAVPNSLHILHGEMASSCHALHGSSTSRSSSAKAHPVLWDVLS